MLPTGMSDSNKIIKARTDTEHRAKRDSGQSHPNKKVYIIPIYKIYYESHSL